MDSVMFSPNGRAVVSATRGAAITIWDALSFKKRHSIMIGDFPQTSVVCSDAYVALGSADRVHLWNINTGKLHKDLQGHHSRVSSVSFSPDGTKLVAGAEDGIIKVWEIKSGALLQTINGGSGEVSAVAFNPKDDTIAAGLNKRVVKIWDVETGQLKRVLKGHQYVVSVIAYSPDGKTLASGSLDKTIRLWDVETGQLKKTIKEDRIQSISFSPDGKILALGSDFTIKLRDLSK